MATDVRLQYYGAQYGRIISVLLVLSAIAAFAAAGFVYTNPPIEQTSPEETNVQSFSFDTDHRATITGPTQLFDRGRTLQNYPVYFQNASPDVTFATTISVPQDRSVDVSYRVIANYEATFRGEVFWDRQEVIASNKWTVQDGQVQHNTTLTVSEYLSRIDPFESAVGSTGTLSRDLRFVVTYSSPVDGGSRYEGQLRSTTTVQSSSDAYWVSSEIGDSTTKSQTQSSEQYVGQPNMQQVRLIAGSGGILFIAGVSVFVWTRRQDDPAELELAVVRDRYDEWISEGELPTGAANEYVYINSLEGIVDIAIDTNKRVIYDADLETYSVVDGNIIYYYARDPTAVSSWLNLSVDE
jgi:hypothetical protein